MTIGAGGAITVRSDAAGGAARAAAEGPRAARGRRPRAARRADAAAARTPAPGRRARAAPSLAAPALPYSRAMAAPGSPTSTRSPRSSATPATCAVAGRCSARRPAARRVGVRRIQVPAGAWSTPVHDHGGAEEIFYVLAGRGLSWHDGATAEIGAGDCIVYLAGAGGHTLHAHRAARRARVRAAPPRPQHALPAPRPLDDRLALRRHPCRTRPGGMLQFAREVELGPPELPAAPGPRTRIANLADVEPVTIERPRIARTRRNLGRAAGSVATGLQHVEVRARQGERAAPLPLARGGDLRGARRRRHAAPRRRADAGPRRPRRLAARRHRRRPPVHRRPGGLAYLAYGTREAGDVCYYPDSRKILFSGVDVIVRVERLDYWDGED